MATTSKVVAAMMMLVFASNFGQSNAVANKGLQMGSKNPGKDSAKKSNVFLPDGSVLDTDQKESRGAASEVTMDAQGVIYHNDTTEGPADSLAEEGEIRTTHLPCCFMVPGQACRACTEETEAAEDYTCEDAGPGGREWCEAQIQRAIGLQCEQPLMAQHCKKTCGLCPVCEDFHNLRSGQCQGWLNAGMCTSENSGWRIRYFCPRTCGRCEAASITATTATANTATTAITNQAPSWTLAPGQYCLPSWTPAHTEGISPSDCKAQCAADNSCTGYTVDTTNLGVCLICHGDAETMPYSGFDTYWKPEAA